MIQYVYRTKSLDRRLDRLRKSDKKGVQAARQVEKIIDILNCCGDAFQLLKRKQTKYGELRLSNCRKYDLGSGYRLITVQDEDCLILVYVGSHDDCHLWLEKQKDASMNVSILKSSGNLIHVTYSRLQPDESLPLTNFAPETDPYEEDLLGKIDEKTLRYIFCGLCWEK